VKSSPTDLVRAAAPPDAVEATIAEEPDESRRKA
jgi:hypothetical protein